MKDFLGNTLALNDVVIFIAPNYRHLVKGSIISFTNKKVRIKFLNTWNYGPAGYLTELLQDPIQLVKVQ